MSDKFQNKYRIPSARLQNWNYCWAGAYFITICTHNREHFFGEILNGIMNFSPVGAIADVLWHEIKSHSKEIELGEFVVMPNHIHGILILNGNKIIETGHAVETGHALSLQNENANYVETGHALSLRSKSELTIGQQRFQNVGKNSVSSIIGSYKSAVTKHAHRLGFDFAWQTRFYDHIIRNEISFQQFSNYIINNPSNWTEDKYFQ